MGLATIDAHSQKKPTEIHKIPKFGINRASFKKKLTKKCMEIRTFVRICPDFHTFLCKFFRFLNACISVQTSAINTRLLDFVTLGALFLTMWINSWFSPVM